MKQCTKCNQRLDESMFNVSNRNKSGLRAECRDCQREQSKQYSENPLVRAAKYIYSQLHKDAYRKADQKRNATEKRRLYKREKSHEPNTLVKKNIFSKLYKSEPANQIKIDAHYVVRQAIRKGIFSRGICEYAYLGDCYGTPQGHHDDYNKPLEVRWLCGRHHKNVHLGKLK